MKRVSLVQLGEDLREYLRAAQEEEILITRSGKPAGLLIGFAREEDWLDYQLENDPRFLRRVETVRKDLRAGRGGASGRPTRG